MKALFLLLSFLVALAPLCAEHHGGKEGNVPSLSASDKKAPNLVALKKRHMNLKRSVEQEHREWTRLDREIRRALRDNPEAAAPYEAALRILKKEHKRSHLAMDRVAGRIAALEAPKACGMDGCVCTKCKTGECGCEICQKKASKSGKEKDCCGEDSCCKKPKEDVASHDHHGESTHSHRPAVSPQSEELKSLEADARELLRIAEELQKKVEALQKSQ